MPFENLWATSSRRGLESMVEEAQGQYPALRRFPISAELKSGQGAGFGEVFPGFDPSGLKPPEPFRIEIYDPNSATPEFIAGEALHGLGLLHPATRVPIDREFRRLKLAFLSSLTPQQRALDRRIYERNVRSGEEQRPFDLWMDQSRLDAYLRGYLFPDADDEWRRSGTYTAQQRSLLEHMREYLTRPQRRLGF